MATQYAIPADDDTNAWINEAQDTRPLSKEEIVGILRDQERASVSFRDTVLAGEQAAALDYYEAEPFGDEEEGRSQVVVPDVAEVVDYMQISVLRTIASGDRVVEFEPGDTDEIPDLPEQPVQPQVPPQPQGDPNDPQYAQQATAYVQQYGPVLQAYQQQKAQYDQAIAAFRRWEDQQKKAAEDATEAVNYIFLRRQNGYRILIDWIQSGLIEKIGIIKTACVTERKKIRQAATVSEDQLALLAQEGAEIASATQNPDGSWSVIAVTYQEVKRYIDMPVPSEEFIFPPRTRDEDSSPYLAWRGRKTLSDLVEMGFDRQTVENLPTDDGNEFRDSREFTRWRDETNVGELAYQKAPMMREVMLLEEYAYFDLDDDGVAELWQIFRVGDVILDMNEVDDHPFVVWTPFPRAHRMVGNSLAEKTMDIQRVNSVLLRQALDGTYMTNSPRVAISNDAIGDDTIDDLLTVRPGGIVRYNGANAPAPLNEPFDIQKSLGMLEYMAGLRETRTGITRLNQGLDEDTINKTASGQAALQATGQQMEEYVARNFAEALARLFAKKLRLMKEHGNPFAIKVDGNYRRVDPTTWDSDMNVAVRVGLGSGRKEQRLAYRAQLLPVQEQGLQYGLTDAKRLYNNAVGMIRDANLGNPDDYFVDPDSEEFQQAQANKPPQIDPNVLKAQMQGVAAQQDAQTRAEESARKVQLMQDESTAKVTIMHQEGQQKIALAAADAEQKQRLAESKAMFEANLATQTADRNFQLAIMQETNRHELAKQSQANAHEINMTKAKQVPQERPGGDLDK